MKVKDKGKGLVLGIALLTSDPYLCEQKHFTISEVAADWHELMTPQRTMWPSIACTSEQMDPQSAASRHTTTTISHTKPPHCSP